MLNVCYIVADQTDKWFELSVRNAARVADRFVFVIDMPNAYTWKVIEFAQSLKPVVLLHKKYERESKKADGNQRTAYLDWLKNNALHEWALVLDTDEIVSDNAHALAKRFKGDIECYDVRMHHLWWTLGTEDATVEKHFVPRRFFKVLPTIDYPSVEHPILQGYVDIGKVEDVAIFHFSVTRGTLEEIRKFKTQCLKSNIHGPDQLRLWHAWHVLGTAPLKRFDVRLLPQCVKDFACIDERGEPVLYAGDLNGIQD